MSDNSDFISNIYIKVDTKSKLNKHWVQTIIGWVTAGFFFGLLIYLYYLFQSIAYNGFDITNASQLTQGLYSVALVVIFSLLYLLTVSPILMGLKRYNIYLMKNQTLELSELFYFFNKAEYAKVIIFNLRLYTRKILLACVALSPLILYMVTVVIIDNSNNSVAVQMYNNYVKFIEPFNNLIFSILIIIGLLVYFALTRKYMLAPYLYVLEETENKEIFKKSVSIYKSNKKTANKLSHSMFWLYLLSLTIVAIIYTIPYIQSVYANMANQLISKNKQQL